jgi:hypothetical protein
MTPAEIIKRFRMQRIDKQSAAVSQLESAIILWWNNRDAASIHTLAVASHDYMTAMIARKGDPSPFRTWLKSQPRRFQEKAAEAQNFLKHGSKDWNKDIQISPLFAEMMMYDSVVSHQKAFGGITPLMRAFATRFVIENSDMLGKKFESAAKGLNIDYIAELNRGEAMELLRQLFSLASTRVDALPPHLTRLLDLP